MGNGRFLVVCTVQTTWRTSSRKTCLELSATISCCHASVTNAPLSRTPRSPVLIISTWASRLSEDNDEICRGEKSKNKLNTTNRVRNKQFVTTAKLPELTELPTTVIKKASYSTIRKKRHLFIQQQENNQN